MPTKKVFLVNTVPSSRPRRSAGADTKYALWGGGSATVVPEQAGEVVLAELQCVPSVVGARAVTRDKGRASSRRKVEEELLDPEEEQKRRMRRDRNRLAAAKCRKRRLDQIDTLQVEVDSWVKRNKMLEDELATLRAEKEEMAFILAAHKTTCKLEVGHLAGEEVLVKLEPEQEAAQPQVYVQVEAAPQVTLTKPQRPASLSLSPVASKKSIHGVTIDTPSNAILSFDTLMSEARTGLTPTSVLTPVKLGSALNTPTCGAQHSRGGLVFTPLFSPNTEAALLTTL